MHKIDTNFVGAGAGFHKLNHVFDRWLPLVYQIASRMGSGDRKTFRPTLEQLVLNLCEDHPHHMMPKLLALVNGRALPPDQHQRIFHVVSNFGCFPLSSLGGEWFAHVCVRMYERVVCVCVFVCVCV